MNVLKVLMAGFLFFAVTSPAWAVSDLLKEARDNFKPLPDKPVFKADNPGTAAKLKLGKALYFETRLSKSNVFSCNSCHNLAGGGVDNNAFSTGHKWNVGGRNAPTVWNASLHIAQFWDGRAKDVEAQAQGPVLADVEMAATKDIVLKRLGSIPEYVVMFRKAFPGIDSLTYKNMADAIGAFERTLLTPSRFDSFLKGDESALTAHEKTGLKIFMDKGCAACHEGVAVGGGMYAKFGVVNKPAFLKDEGRFGVTKQEDDKNVFKVPSLRNIEFTYPYFNDGSVWNLSEAVKIMGWTQLGEKLSAKEIGDIVAFLNSMTGKLPEITLPKLPASTPLTPKPDRS